MTDGADPKLLICHPFDQRIQSHRLLRQEHKQQLKSTLLVRTGQALFQIVNPGRDRLLICVDLQLALLVLVLHPYMMAGGVSINGAFEQLSSNTVNCHLLGSLIGPSLSAGRLE